MQQGLTVRGHCSFKLQRLCDIEDAGGTLARGCLQMDRAGVEWWVSSGTALGLWRDGDFIPTDSDHDVGVMATAGQRHLEIDGMRLARTSDYGDLPTQTAYIDANGCIFDIYYYYSDLMPGHLVSVAEGGTIVKLRRPVRRYSTKYGDLPFLSPPAEYLAERYGDGWITPSDSKPFYSPLGILDL